MRRTGVDLAVSLWTFVCFRLWLWLESILRPIEVLAMNIRLRASEIASPFIVGCATPLDPLDRTHENLDSQPESTGESVDESESESDCVHNRA